MTARPAAMVIGGMPRSGTTLLAALCRTHPEISMTIELKSYSQLGATFHEYAHASWERLRYVRGSWRFHGPRFQNSLLNFASNVFFLVGHLARMWRHVDGVVTPRAVAASTAFGAKVAADKFPDYVFAIDELVRAPDIRCVAIYRDCRDVASSFLQKVRTTWKHQAWVEGLDDAAEISRRWVRSLEIMEAESERVLAIKYEDLVRQPAAELKRLALWLDVDPYTFRVGDVRDTSIGKFARGLTAKELEAVIDVAGPTMERFGYR